MRSRRERAPHLVHLICLSLCVMSPLHNEYPGTGCLSEELLCSAFSQWLSKCFPFLTGHTHPGQAGSILEEMAFAISNLPEAWKMPKITLQEDKVIWLPLVVLFKPTATTTKSTPHLSDPFRTPSRHPESTLSRCRGLT